MSTTNNVIKNISYLSIAELISKLISFLINIFIANYFKVEEFGIIGFCTSTISYFYLISNFGIDLHLIKAFAKGEIKDNNKGDYISIKFILALISLFILLLLSMFINDTKTKLVLIIYSFTILSSSLNISWYYQSKDKMIIVSFVKIIEAIINLVVLLTLLIFLKDIILLPLSMFISQVLIYVYYIRYSGSKIRLKFNFNLLLEVLKKSFPLGLSSLSILIYYNFDMLLLKYFKSEYDIGLYNAAVKIFLISIIALNIILTVYFPKLSRSYNDFSFLKGKTFRHFFLSLLFVGLFTSILIFFCSDFIIRNIFKADYENSILPLKILSFNIILVAVNIALGNPLIALNKYKLYLFAISAGAFTNIALNIFMIPKYSYIGASYTTLASEGVVLLFLLFVYFLNIKYWFNEKL